MKFHTTIYSNKLFAKSIRHFFFIFLFIGMIASGCFYLFYSYQSKEFVHDLLVREESGVALRKTVIEDSLNVVVSDLEFLATLDSMRAFAEGVSGSNARVEKDFLAFSKAKGTYDQVRLFDTKGVEVVRINNDNGFPSIAPREKLQNKYKRYYFKDTIEMKVGGVFVSPMDLNIENGEVEIPYNPVIRFGTPLYGQNGSAVGALILNYKADNLLGMLRKTGSITNGQSMLVNKRGYWLLAPDLVDQWAFMFEDRKNISFAERYPKLWSRIRSSESGQIVTGNQIFTYTTVYPLDVQFLSSTGSGDAFEESKGGVRSDQYYWKLISFVPNSANQGYTKPILVKIFIVGAMLFFFAGGLAWFVTLILAGRVISIGPCEECAGEENDE